MLNGYDVIVIGVGSMGSAACFELARRGVRVLGIERFSSPHDRGSHSGQSRIIRKAYFEHPDYVPLLERAYEKWDRLELETNEKLFYRTGLVYYGPSGHPIMAGTKQSAELHSLLLEINKTDYFQFSVPGAFESLFEKDAGFVRPEKTISLMCAEAQKYGAVLRNFETVTRWIKKNGMFQVETNKDTYYAKKLIITAGAWSQQMIGRVISLKVTRQIIAWVEPKTRKDFFPDSFPCWLIADDSRAGALYGFPYLREKEFGIPGGMKFAWHYPAEAADPDRVTKSVDADEVKKLIGWVGEYIPDVGNATIVDAQTCLYANSKDEHFIIDLLPDYNNDVVIACGFSGHGFKFVPVVGEILADLATEGQTDLPISFLGMSRFNPDKSGNGSINEQY